MLGNRVDALMADAALVRFGRSLVAGLQCPDCQPAAWGLGCSAIVLMPSWQMAHWSASGVPSWQESQCPDAPTRGMGIRMLGNRIDALMADGTLVDAAVPHGRTCNGWCASRPYGVGCSAIVLMPSWQMPHWSASGVPSWQDVQCP